MNDRPRMTDHWYADRLEEMAVKALRKNQARHFQMSWAESALIPGWEELAYIQAAAPSVVLRLLRRLRRLEGRVASCPCGCSDHTCEHSGFYVCEACPPGCHGTSL